MPPPPPPSPPPPPPFALGIETSNPSAGSGVVVAERSGGGVWAERARADLGPTRRHDDALVRLIDSACRSAGVRPRGLGRVAVSAGPGGFSAVRIAIATAQMIAEAGGSACVGVPTDAALTRRAAPPADEHAELVVCLGWKRDDAWASRWTPASGGSAAGWTLAAGGAVAPIDELAAAAPGRVLVCDHRLAAVLRERSARPADLVIEPPCFDPLAVLEASEAVEPVDPASLLPIYPREPEAVSKWRRLHGR